MLPPSHAFGLVGDDEVPALVPRGQLGPLVSGLAFCPVSALAESLRLQVVGPTALIVPGNSRTTLPSLPSHLAVEGPMQISVLDAQAGTTYKRQVILVHLIPGIVYRPVTVDAVIIDTDDFVELVVEVFEKLAADFPAYVGRSMSDLRGILEGFLPDGALQSCYTLRILQGSPHGLGRVFQITLKVPLRLRLASPAPTLTLSVISWHETATPLIIPLCTGSGLSPPMVLALH